jgi:hypothetical protein
LPCLSGSKGCPGGSNVGDAACAKGYAGLMCSSCAQGYYMTSGTFFSCGTTASRSIFALTLLALLLLYVVVLCILWYYKYVASEDKPYILKQLTAIQEWLSEFFGALMVKLKIIIATFQVVISTADVFNVVMPGRFAQFSRSFNVLNLDIGSLIPLSCIMENVQFNFMFRLFLSTIGPLVLVVMLLLVMVIERYVLKSNILTEMKSKDYNNEIKGRYVNYIFYLTYLILPSVTTTIFQLFLCENIDPHNEDDNNNDRYLLADVNISCTSEYYYRWRLFGIVMVAIYPIGIPLFYGICLYSFRNDIKKSRDYFDFSTSVSGSTKQSQSGL